MSVTSSSAVRAAGTIPRKARVTKVRQVMVGLLTRPGRRRRWRRDHSDARGLLCAGRLLFEHLEHVLGDELHARLIEVVAVVRQDAARLVFGVVLLPVLHEGLA